LGETLVKLCPCTTPINTLVPPAGAGALRVTVPVVEDGALNGPAGEKVNSRIVIEGGGAVTLTVAVLTALPGTGVEAEIVALIGLIPSARPEALSANVPTV
jgi:hypothetical protein